MDEFEAMAKRMKELGLNRDKPFDQPLAPDFAAELNRKLIDAANKKPIAPETKPYDQAAIERAHGVSKGDDGEYYYILGPV